MRKSLCNLEAKRRFVEKMKRADCSFFDVMKKEELLCAYVCLQYIYVFNEVCEVKLLL
jgi:hypothetical protein